MEGIEKTNDNNIYYYMDLANKIGGVMPRWTVQVLTVIVGTPGTWPDISTKTLVKIGIRSNIIRTIARHCVLSNIRWSAAQWKFHRDGIMADYSNLTNIQISPSLLEPDKSIEVNLLDDLIDSNGKTESESDWSDLSDVFGEA